MLDSDASSTWHPLNGQGLEPSKSSYLLGPLLDLFVILLADDDGSALSGHDLLQGVHALRVHRVLHHDQDDGHGRVHQSERSMLQFSGLDKDRSFYRWDTFRSGKSLSPVPKECLLLNCGSAEQNLYINFFYY